MKKLYVKLSECELNLLKNYAQKTGTKTYRKAIEKLIEEDAVSVICIASAIEKHLRKTAVNYHQIESFVQEKDSVFAGEIKDTISTAIHDISSFNSSILSKIQKGSDDRFEVQIRLLDTTKETLMKMKKEGCFRTYDALLRFMLTTHFSDVDFNNLGYCFDTIKKIGHLFNQTAHSFHLNHYVDSTGLRQIMSEYQSAIGVVIEMIGDK